MFFEASTKTLLSLTIMVSPSGGDIKQSLLSSPLRTCPLAIHPNDLLESPRSESKDFINYPDYRNFWFSLNEGGISPHFFTPN